MMPSNNTLTHQRTRSIKGHIVDECNLRPRCIFDAADEVTMRLVLFFMVPQGLAWTLFIEVRPTEEHYIVVDGRRHCWRTRSIDLLI
jgi:hypothetical protein